MSGIRELYPFGDLDQAVIERAAGLLPAEAVADVAAGLALAATAVDLLESVSAPLQAAGLSPARWRLLVALRFQSDEHSSTIGELAAHLGVREPTITASVSRAARDGHVVKVRDAEDLRVVRVRLTQTGLATVASLIPVMVARVSSLVAACGGRRAVLDMAGRISAAVAADRDGAEAGA